MKSKNRELKIDNYNLYLYLAHIKYVITKSHTDKYNTS